LTNGLFQPKSHQPTLTLLSLQLFHTKKVGLAVEAYNKSGFPLRVVGTGSRLDRLKSIAKPNITFLERSER